MWEATQFPKSVWEDVFIPNKKWSYVRKKTICFFLNAKIWLQMFKQSMQNKVRN